ncbi:hypothetical protein FSS13T_20540 [Flavobacterium saliperosum S13]|uniref:Lipoprotein n=1 Tax=Flavobacterium saliperosum S13 TaxID=1341155 RepID=A0ABN0QEZ2_9FLAO|nr:hypothetical protein FSS13T_20540 [Flavobacterium saliperosum S13]
MVYFNKMGDLSFERKVTLIFFSVLACNHFLIPNHAFNI